MIAPLAQYVGKFAVNTDRGSRCARPGLHDQIHEETLCARLVNALAVHDLGEDSLGVDEPNSIGGVGVPAGSKLLGDSPVRSQSGHQDERVPRVGALGEEFRNGMMNVRFSSIELNRVTSGAP